MATKKEDAEQAGDSPVTRQRQPYVADSENQEAQQKAAVEAHEAQRAAVEQAHVEQSLPIKLSDKGFVGKVAGEPDLEPEVVERVRGTVGFGPGVSKDPEFDLVDVKEHGHVTGKIVVTGARRENGIPGALPLSDAQKVAKAISEDGGGKKGAKEPSDKEKQQTLADAQATVAGIDH